MNKDVYILVLSHISFKARNAAHSTRERNELN